MPSNQPRAANQWDIPVAVAKFACAAPRILARLAPHHLRRISVFFPAARSAKRLTLSPFGPPPPTGNQRTDRARLTGAHQGKGTSGTVGAS